MDGTSSIPIKHQSFWFDDGNIVIFALQNKIAFKLHRSILSFHSEVFRDMFLIPQPVDNDQVEGCPTLHLPETLQDLEYVFTALYDGRKGTFFNPKIPVKFAAASALLRLGSKYQIDHLRNEAIHRLEQCYSNSLSAFDMQRFSDGEAKARPISDLTIEHSIEVVNFARAYDFDTLLPPALYLCTQLPNSTLLYGVTPTDETNAALARLSLEDIRICLDSREDFLRARSQAIIFFTEYQYPNGCTRHRGHCLYPKHNEPAPVNLAPQIRKLAIDHDVLAPLTHRMKGHGLCNSCFLYICDQYNTKKKKVWDDLGRIYGVNYWVPLP